MKVFDQYSFELNEGFIEIIKLVYSDSIELFPFSDFSRKVLIHFLFDYQIIFAELLIV